MTSAAPPKPWQGRASQRGIGLKWDVLLVSLAMHLLALALPLALLQIYDRILPAQAFGTAVFLVAGVAGAILLEALLRYGRLALFAGIGAGYEARTSVAMIERLRHADIAALEGQGPGAVSDAFRAIGQVRDFWSGQAGAALYELPFVALYIGLITYIGGWLAVIPLALFAAALAFALVVAPGIGRWAHASEEAARNRQDFAYALFRALGYLKAIGAESGLVALWRGINLRALAAGAELEARLGWVRETSVAFGQLSTILVVTFGAIATIEGSLTTGALAACTMLAGRSISPAMASLGYWAQLARTREAQARINAILDLSDAPTFDTDVAHDGASIVRGEVALEFVGSPPSVSTISAGEIVRIAGADSAAVSHMLSVVAGLARDERIVARIDGRRPEDYDHDEFRRGVVLVTGRIALVPGSVLDNLTLFDRRYDDEALAICETLGLRPTLDSLRNGVLTDVGPANAEWLDEGVYQRLSIVRALLRKPRILILDHAATGIDLDGEKRLAAYLRGLAGKTTILIATNRPALAEICARTISPGEGEPQ